MILRIVLVCNIIRETMHSWTSHAPASRTVPLAAVAALHVALVSALLVAMPGVRERIASPAPIYVQFRDAPRVAPAETRPLPRPALRDPVPVTVAPPVVALAPEIAVTPPGQREPSISGPVASNAPAQPAVQATQPPRFDMAYLDNPPPAYPPLARRMKEQGRVLLHVLVSAEGTAQDVEVRTSSGSERLDRAAVEAVRRWRFIPAHRGDEKVAAWALVPILFQLDT
jgi:protein TonB